MEAPAAAETANWKTAKAALEAYDAAHEKFLQEHNLKRAKLVLAATQAHNAISQKIRELEDADAVAFAKNPRENVDGFILVNGNCALVTGDVNSPTRHVCLARWDIEARRRGDQLAKAESAARQKYNDDWSAYNSSFIKNIAGVFITNYGMPVLHIPTWAELAKA